MYFTSFRVNEYEKYVIILKTNMHLENEKKNKLFFEIKLLLLLLFLNNN